MARTSKGASTMTFDQVILRPFVQGADGHVFVVQAAQDDDGHLRRRGVRPGERF